MCPIFIPVSLICNSRPEGFMLNKLESRRVALHVNPVDGLTTERHKGLPVKIN